MASLIVDLIFWLSIVLSSTYLLHLIARKTRNLPPGPVGLPVVGSLLQLSGMPHEAFARLSKQYGPLMTVWLGSRATVVVSSAEMAEEVLHRQNQVFSGRIVPDVATALEYDLHSFGLSQVGPRWQALRRMSNSELFTPRRLDALKELREEKVRVLLQHVREACADGRAIDISEYAFATTLNLVSSTLFSEDLVDLDSESAGEFKSFMWEMLEIGWRPNLCDYFPVLRWIDPQGLRRRNKRILTRVYVLFDKLIDKHLSAYEDAAAKGEPKKNEDFVDVLLELTRDPDSGFTKENIRPMLLDLFIAGSETSATTLEWAMTELLRHPDKMAAARSEIKQTVGEGNFFIPFGAGKRICPGVPLASRMVLLVLASLINSFSWVLPNKMAPQDLDMEVKFRLVQQRANPLKVIPVPLTDM
ncbi:Geraniol 8-hydroxylase [Nymphaea thermarum]|nr:Geraniol 8-hydroxylase [Nymphaea thermarum]